MHTYVHYSIIYNSQGMEVTYVPINRQLDKEETVHIQDGILLVHKKNEILLFLTTWYSDQ